MTSRQIVADSAIIYVDTNRIIIDWKFCMKEKKKYLDGTKKVLDESQKETSPYWVEILGKKFIVYPNVFSPKYFFDTEFFAKEIFVEQGEEFLEIGPGSGVVSVWMALKGAIVAAVDINPDAVKNTQENAKIHKMEKQVSVYEGNLYSPIGDKKFDTVFWNTPFGYTENEDVTTLEKAVFDPGYKSTRTFIEEAKNHLKEGGRLLIGFSSTLGHIEKLKELIKNNGFTFRTIASVESVETHPVKFELFESKAIIK